MFKISFFQNHNWLITTLIFVLLAIGVITIYSTTHNAANISEGSNLFSKQLILIVIGLATYFSLTLFDFRWLKEPKLIALIYTVTILLLLYAKLFTNEIAGTNRWISIGPLTIQPAEYAKLTIIILASVIFVGKTKLTSGKYSIINNSNRSSKIHSIFSNFSFLSKLIFSLPFILLILFLILIQPSLGNTIITALIFASLVLIYYPNKLHLICLIITFIFSAVIGWQAIIGVDPLNLMIIISLTAVAGILIKYIKPNIVEITLVIISGLLLIPSVNFAWQNIIEDYQKVRVETFLNPASDPQGAGWQIRQSTIAIGSGRVFGKGILKGTQSGLRILPYPYTDFIFAAYAEQFGTIGSTFLIIILLALPLKIFWVAADHEDHFAKLISYGVGTLLLIHIFINVGMNLGKLPVTGIPLPLVSYGGSSIIVNLIGLGLVQNTLKYKYEDKNVTRLAL